MTDLYTLFACAVVVIFASAQAWLTYLAFTAPRGWQDRNGYHDGEPTEADLLSDYDND